MRLSLTGVLNDWVNQRVMHMKSNKQFTEVEIGQHKVKVPQNGYYDRFRINPDLD
ncbi:hypothetical protein F909_02498 [Acinetobacter sp. ANC 3929]|nr:hypothetical protein F909_02498 [Acinetobacter sp. ANC 3929]